MFKIKIQCGLLFFCLSMGVALADTNTGNFVSVCDRTEQIQNAILSAVVKEDCSTVTASDLETISVLDLSDSEINKFRPEDFQGLNAVQELDISDNPLLGTFVASALPEGLFDDMTSLEMIIALNVGPDRRYEQGLRFRDGLFLRHVSSHDDVINRIRLMARTAPQDVDVSVKWFRGKIPILCLCF